MDTKGGRIKLDARITTDKNMGQGEASCPMDTALTQEHHGSTLQELRQGADRIVHRVK